MDIKSIKEHVRITDLIDGSNLKKVASTGGGELAGPCPICGGRDRFRVQPANNIWLCRHCTDGKWKDPIDFVAISEGITLGEAMKKLAAGMPQVKYESKKPAEEPEYTRSMPPLEAWQARAREAVDQCHDRLYTAQGEQALKYLHWRGLKDHIIRRYKLGYSTGKEKIKGLYIYHGITIPCEIAGDLWYVNVRLSKDDPRYEDGKYRMVMGSKRKAIFNADRLEFADTCLITEGEFNAMIGEQELNTIIPVASVGSATHTPELVQWGPYFINKKLILAAYDDDKEGVRGSLNLRESFGERVKLTALPPGKDLNDFYREGGDLFEWIDEYLQMWQPLGDLSIAK